MPGRMLIRNLLVAAILSIGAATSSAAAELRMEQMPSGGGPAIVLSGLIVAGDETRFHALTQTVGQATVITSGPGGSVGSAIAIGTEIRTRGWSTLVPNNAQCASACSMIWLAGQSRRLAAGAQIGFHAMSRMQNGERAEDHELDFVLRQWLSDLGYALDTTATIVNTPAASIHWYDAGELRANGIATELYP
jgi:hypothetical protein